MGKRRLSFGQLVLLGLVVVALVFVVTYAKINVVSPTRKDGVGDNSRPTQLDFTVTAWPPVDPQAPEPAVDFEWHKDGHHNFWFDNNSAKPVQVYLEGVNCYKCTRVEIVLVPAEMKDKIPAQLDAWAEKQKLDWHVLPKDDTKGFTVPAHTGGGVRLNWKAEKLGKEQVFATLRTESGTEAGFPIRVQASLNLVTPFQVSPEDNLSDERRDQEILVDTLRTGDVRTVNLIAWSSTKDQFSLKVEPPDDPCIQVGAPELLSKEEAAKVGRRDMKTVLCAYRVPVTVRERTPDGKQFELGRFRRHIQFTSTDPGIEPATVAIGGIVRGEITVGSPDDNDMVALGSFERSEGKSKPIRITTAEANLDLALEERPEFLKADLEEDKTPDQLGRSWTLTVAVPPDGLNGTVPPHTAIILKTKGERPRRIRIPVTGNAYVR